MKELCQSDLGHGHGSATDGASRAFWDARHGRASAWQTDREGRTRQKVALGVKRSIGKDHQFSPGWAHLIC